MMMTIGGVGVLPCALLSKGALDMIEIEHTAVLLYWPFAGAGARAVWKHILGCFPPACCDKRPNLLLGGGIFTSIVR